LETSFKYESNGILLVTYNSYFIDKISSQSSTSKRVMTLYTKSGESNMVLIYCSVYLS
jgi:hypothetical protein